MQLTFQTSEQSIIDEINQFIKSWESLMSIDVNTSGSTGKPKKIIHSKNAVIASVKNTAEFFQLKNGDRAFMCLSPNSIGGKMMLIRSIVLELNLTVGDIKSQPFNVSNPCYDFVAMVPMQVEAAISSGIDLSGIKHLIIGGAPISKELEEQIIRLKLNAYQTFGMTETISHIALRKIEQGNLTYTILPGISIHVNNGKLVIDAPSLNVHQLETNDLVEIKRPNEFIWLGRADRTINSGGIKIQLEMIEQILGNIIGLPSFAFALPDSVLGERLCIAIEGDLHLDKDKLNQSFPKYSVPKEIYFFKKFHYTSSGKLDRINTLTEITNVKKQVL